MTATVDNSDPFTGDSRRVFVSYGHDQYEPLTARLAQDLRDGGHQVWFDRDRIRPGEDYVEYIAEGLEWTSSTPGAGYFVLIMTPHSVRRPDGFCLKELARAVQRRLKIVPVMAATVEPPLWIADQRAERYTTGLARLRAAIGGAAAQFDGVQARLRQRLAPIPFHNDVLMHLRGFTGRTWLVDEYQQWLKDDRGEPVFWLTGDPGVGKSAFAAHLVSTRPEIYAHHFCRYGDSERVDADGVTALSSHGKKINVWDLRTLKAIRKLRDLRDAVWAVAISADGRKGAAATSERVIVWDLDTGRCTSRVQETGFDGHRANPPLEFDAAATRVRFGNPLAEWVLTTNRVRALSESSDAGRLLAIDEAATVGLRFVEGDGMHVWNLQRRAMIRKLPGLRAVAAVDISPDGRWAIDTAFTHEVRLWDLRMLGKVASASEGLEVTHRMDLTPDGVHVVLTHDIRPRHRPPKGRRSVPPPRRRSVWDIGTGRRLSESAAQKVLGKCTGVVRMTRGPARRDRISVRDGEFTLDLGDGYVARYREEGWTVRVENRKTGERFATFDCDAPLVACGAAGSTVVIVEVSGRAHFVRLEGIPKRPVPGNTRRR